MADPKFVDLKYTKAEAKAEQRGMTMGKPPQYPWGLCIRLEKDELDKLGIKELPQVGTEVHFAAIAKVTSVNQSSSEDQDEETSVALQITMLSVLKLESAAEEKGEKETPASEAKETNTLLGKYK